MTLFDNIKMNGMAPMSDQVIAVFSYLFITYNYSLICNHHDVQLATFEFFQIIGMRLARALIFEQTFLMNTIFFLVKPFLSPKIRERFSAL